jgi:exopolysaccharide biosynthesis polyprenyl glycosylphosphotransferase
MRDELNTLSQVSETTHVGTSATDNPAQAHASTAALEDVFANELILIDGGEAADQRRGLRGASHDTFLRRSLAVSDLAAVALSFALTLSKFAPPMFDLASFAALLLVVPAMKMAGLYDRDANLLHKTTLDDVPRLAAVSMALTILVFAMRDVVTPGPGAVDPLALPILCVGMTFALTVMRRITRTAVRAVTPEERLLVIGGDEDTERLRYRLERTASVKARVVARIPVGYAELPYGPARLLSQPRQLAHVTEDNQIDRIVIMPGERHSDEVGEVIRTVRSIDVKLNVMPSSGDAIGAVTLVDDVAGIQMVALRDVEMSGSSLLLKRCLDIVGALFAILLLSPIFIACAIAIKLDSRGPVLYRQRRIGRNGKPFRMLKFRSMQQDADAMKQDLAHLSVTPDFFKIENDPRITRVGGFIRNSSIDELPQLINILRGDMSLVGPRPLVPEEDSAITGWYRRRSQITPGATGVWQLLGKVRIPIDDMAKLDYMYVANWTLWSDIKILIRTVNHVLLRRGL